MLNEIKKIIKPIYRLIVKISYLSGYKTWPTKSYEVWLFVQFLLFKTKPQVLCELGSGRSTHYLSEYCQKKGSTFFSIEQNKAYIRKNKIGLKSSYLKPEGLHYIPIKDDWFDVDKLRDVLSGNTAEFILIDAPGGGGKGSRNSIVGNLFLEKFTHHASVIVIDDFHREEVRRSVSAILPNRRGKYVSFLFLYPIDDHFNEILFLVKKEFSESCSEFIRLFSLDDILIKFDYSMIDFS